MKEAIIISPSFPRCAVNMAFSSCHNSPYLNTAFQHRLGLGANGSEQLDFFLAQTTPGLSTGGNLSYITPSCLWQASQLMWLFVFYSSWGQSSTDSTAKRAQGEALEWKSCNERKHGWTSCKTCQQFGVHRCRREGKAQALHSAACVTGFTLGPTSKPRGISYQSPKTSLAVSLEKITLWGRPFGKLSTCCAWSFI